MSSEDSELRFGSNKILISIKISMSLLLMISVVIIENIPGYDRSPTIDYFLRWLFALGFSSFIILLSDLREHCIIISAKGVTYEYYGAFKQKVLDDFACEEIEKFEKVNSLVFFKKIRIILKKSHSNCMRNCKIWIHNSETPRDEIYDILTEKLVLGKQKPPSIPD